MSNLPLGLPEGSVRAIIAVVCIVGAVGASILVLVAKMRGVEMEIPEAVMVLAGTVMGYYFGVRTATQRKEETPAIENEK